MGPDDTPRAMNREVADAVAPGWERQRAFVEGVAAPVRAWLVSELAPKPGETVLELAAGAGDTGFEVAAILGESGHLITTDVSPVMLDVARRRGAELGVTNVEYRVVDAGNIELAADSVDGVLCRYAYMFMEDPAQAFSEARRVLRPGGRLAFAVWGPPERNPFFTTIVMTLVARGHFPPPDPEAPGLFTLANEARLRALVEGAGFETVRTEEVPAQFTFADVDEYLNIVTDTAGPIAIALRGLPDGERDDIKASLSQALGSFESGGGYELPGATVCASAS